MLKIFNNTAGISTSFSFRNVVFTVSRVTYMELSIYWVSRSRILYLKLTNALTTCEKNPFEMWDGVANSANTGFFAAIAFL